jgi:hypothetical protein
VNKPETIPSSSPRNAVPPPENLHPTAEHEQAVLKAIRETAYGTIEVTVHQSKIVQITRSEKLRL